MAKFSHSQVLQRAFEMTCKELSACSEYDGYIPEKLEEKFLEEAELDLQNAKLRQTALRKLTTEEAAALGLKKE